MHQSLSEQAENTKHELEDVEDEDKPAPPNDKNGDKTKKSAYAQAVAQIEAGNESTTDSSEAAEATVEEGEKQEAVAESDQTQQADDFEQHEEEEEEEDDGSDKPSSEVKQKVHQLTKKLASKALAHKKTSKTEVKVGNNKKKSVQALA